MAEFVYVDNSNVFIEGKRVSAVRKGYAMDIWEAIENKILDNSYRMDFGRLHDFIAGTDLSKIKRAMLFGSRPPPNDTLWKVAEKAGFEVIVEDRNVANREKKIDTGIVTKMTKDAYTKADPKTDTITLVAGDKDYVPTVEELVSDGFHVEVAFWSHAAAELKSACSKFIDLDSFVEHLQLT